MYPKLLKTLKSILLFLSILLFMPQSAVAQVKKVVIFPLELHGDESKGYLRQGLRSMFISRLSDRNIEIIGEEIMRSFFNDEEKGISSQDRAKELAGLMGADYALFGSITALGESYSLDLGILDLAAAQSEPKWISETATEDQLIPKVQDLAEESKAIIMGTVVPEETEKVIPTIPPAEKGSQGGIMFKPPEEAIMMEPAGSLPVRIEVMASDTGDLDGDGEVELVILSREKILVYSKTGDRFALKDSMKPAFGTYFLKVSIGDLDGDGKEEICVVSLDGIRAEGSIWEWAGKFERLCKLKGHLRITEGGNDRGPVILFQESLPQKDRFFYGDIWLMGYSNKGEPAKEEVLKLPRGAQFYTIMFYDINQDGSEEMLFLGRINARERSDLNVSSAEGRILWQSGETFGATNNFVIIEYSEDDYSTRIPLNSGPVLMDSDGDGKKEVVLIKNLSDIDILGNVTYRKSKLSVYKVEGMGLKPFWKSGENDFNVVDMHAEKRVLFVATHRPRTTNLSRESGKIMWFQ